MSTPQTTAGQWIKIVVALVILIAIFGAGSYVAQNNDPAPKETICWHIDGADLTGYSPADPAESTALKTMVHVTVKKRCAGLVFNRLMSWEAGEIWIKRTSPTGTKVRE